MPANLLNIAPSTDRRSACPGLFRMTRALDGFICRIKLPLGRITCQQADEIARLSQTYGNGIIELTIRSNLQLRGVKPENREALIAALIACGLGPLRPEGDDVRNVMVNPTIGMDAIQLTDTTDLANELLRILQLTPRYHALSPKFSLLVDGGEACAITTHPNDIWLSACEDGEHFAFGFASMPLQSDYIIRQTDALAFVCTCLDTFLALAEKFNISRMKQLFAYISHEELIAEIEKQFSGIIASSHWQRQEAKAFTQLGQHKHRDETKYYVSAMPFLGRLSPQDLQKLGIIALSAGADYFCLTPWQSFLIPNIDAEKAPAILRALHEAGFATKSHDIAANIRACSGSKGCASALADTQSDAKQLAQLLGQKTMPFIHLTGCAKSCASLSALPVTLLATKPQHYDLFLQDKTGRSRFGRLLASNITIQDAAKLLQQHQISKPTGTGNV
ncbi:precorrin-3B synthase [Paenochrobactrum sp. BZR 588]|uniref:precorrin-3B synthase n=1 Tax=unclassified Paenochrobactrum TaxID=2639760 RepID=UPI003853FA73